MPDFRQDQRLQHDGSANPIPGSHSLWRYQSSAGTGSHRASTASSLGRTGEGATAAAAGTATRSGSTMLTASYSTFPLDQVGTKIHLSRSAGPWLGQTGRPGEWVMSQAAEPHIAALGSSSLVDPSFLASYAYEELPATQTGLFSHLDTTLSQSSSVGDGWTEPVLTPVARREDRPERVYSQDQARDETAYDARHHRQPAAHDHHHYQPTAHDHQQLQPGVHDHRDGHNYHSQSSYNQTPTHDHHDRRPSVPTLLRQPDLPADEGADGAIELTDSLDDRPRAVSIPDDRITRKERLGFVIKTYVDGRNNNRHGQVDEQTITAFLAGNPDFVVLCAWLEQAGMSVDMHSLATILYLSVPGLVESGSRPESPTANPTGGDKENGVDTTVTNGEAATAEPVQMPTAETRGDQMASEATPARAPAAKTKEESARKNSIEELLNMFELENSSDVDIGGLVDKPKPASMAMVEPVKKGDGTADHDRTDVQIPATLPALQHPARPVAVSGRQPGRVSPPAVPPQPSVEQQQQQRVQQQHHQQQQQQRIQQLVHQPTHAQPNSQPPAQPASRTRSPPRKRRRSQSPQTTDKVAAPLAKPIDPKNVLVNIDHDPLTLAYYILAASGANNEIVEPLNNRFNLLRSLIPDVVADVDLTTIDWDLVYDQLKIAPGSVEAAEGPVEVGDDVMELVKLYHQYRQANECQSTTAATTGVVVPSPPVDISRPSLPVNGTTNPTGPNGSSNQQINRQPGPSRRKSNKPDLASFWCRWRKCGRRFGVVDELRQHLLGDHRAEAEQATDRFVCLWNGCTHMSTPKRAEFPSESVWADHVLRCHLLNIEPTSKPSSRQVKSKAQSKTQSTSKTTGPGFTDIDSSDAYLTDCHGRTVTPRISVLSAKSARPFEPRPLHTKALDVQRSVRTRKLAVGPTMDRTGVRLATDRLRSRFADSAHFDELLDGDDGFVGLKIE